jgi:GrpB-like predicted nucleotidyltransferase (UPF0157 family)
MIDNKYLKVLADIQTRANKEFNDKLFQETTDKDDEAVELVFNEMLKKDLPDWKRKYLEIMKKELTAKKTSVNEEIGALKDKWVEKEIRKAVKKGLLPKKI